MARERYLVNQGESTIHANQISPKTGKEKRFYRFAERKNRRKQIQHVYDLFDQLEKK